MSEAVELLRRLSDRRSRLPPHWYRIICRECPACGRREEWRERVYVEDEPRPKNDADRYDVDSLSGCNCMAAYI